jgi:hypothetical protein
MFYPIVNMKFIWQLCFFRKVLFRHVLIIAITFLTLPNSIKTLRSGFKSYGVATLKHSDVSTGAIFTRAG